MARLTTILKEKLERRYLKLRFSFFGYSRRADRRIRVIGSIFSGAVMVMALASIVALSLGVGYECTPYDRRLIAATLRTAQVIFAAEIIFNLLFRTRETLRASGVLKWIADILLLITIILWITPRPAHPRFPGPTDILFSTYFLYSVLAFYSLVELSFGLMKLVGRRTNPSLLMAGSFLFFILAGSLALMLPKCTYAPIDYVDSLFVSTSAVCITGLTTLDLPTTFTPLGLLVIALMVQVGGLGVLTFTSFFAIFFSGRPSIFNQLMLRDFIYSRSMNALVPVLLYILGFTLVVELAGTLLVYLTLPAGIGDGTSGRLMIAGFHSLSSFCNAGFSYIPEGMANPVLMNGNGNIYLATSLLVFAGGIGFPNLVNFKEVAGVWLQRLRPRSWRKPLPVHIFDMNTKLVLAITLTLFAAGAVGFFILEYNNTLAGMSLHDKIVQSIFNSLTPRSAGFSSVNPASFLNGTLVMVLVLMWIGGASQSLAGGIKVNTLGAVLLNLRAITRGYSGIPAFGRNLAVGSVRRANAVIILSIISLSFYVFVVIMLEPGLSARSVVFECVSALFTVGSSLGITPLLSAASKGVLCTAMFLGRVGIVSLLCGFMGTRRDRSAHLPTESIIIN